MFHQLGVHTIDGGPTLNPSTYDLLAAIHQVPAEEVVLLTNSPNVIMAGEHAARLSDKQVLLAPTTSQQAGLAAAVAHSGDPAGWRFPALETLRGVITELTRPPDGGEAPELISVLEGEGAPLALGELAQLGPERIELELQHGGQSAYWWLLSAE